MKYLIWEDSVAYDLNLLSVFTFQDFEESCDLLRKCGAVQVSDQEVKETEESDRETAREKRRMIKRDMEEESERERE